MPCLGLRPQMNEILKQSANIPKTFVEPWLYMASMSTNYFKTADKYLTYVIADPLIFNNKKEHDH